jgi:peptidoglycan/xylan/chitin deacetylase (PgdA/CDA1 family)
MFVANMNDAKNALFKTALHALYYTCLDTALTPVTQGSGVIFMLHHVALGEPEPFAPNRILSITPEFLELVVEHAIERDFDIVTLDEAHARMKSGKRAARRFATFTFDDGYRDNIQYALPVFRKLGVPMTICVAPDFCDGNGLSWWATLEYVLTVSNEIIVPLAAGDKRMRLKTVAEKYSAFREIYPWLRAMPDVGIHTHVNRWAQEAGVDPYAAGRDLVMNWQEVRAASKDPLVTIGAHSMTHAALAKCSEDEPRWQIKASIEHVEHELGLDCRHFAYPYGDFGSAGPREFEMARAIGLKTAVTTQKGLVPTDAGDHLTSLPRLSLNGDFQDQRLLQVLLNGAPFKMLNFAKAALLSRAA